MSLNRRQQLRNALTRKNNCTRIRIRSYY